MRNPLNAIIGFAEIMQQRHFGPLGDRRYETYAHDIRASADHLLTLVDDLLDLARIEAGKLNLTFTNVALGPLGRGMRASAEAPRRRDIRCRW